MKFQKELLLTNKIRTNLLIKVDNDLKKNILILFPQKHEEIKIKYSENFSSSYLNNFQNNFNNKNNNFEKDKNVIFPRENSFNSVSTCADSNYLTFFKKETSLDLQKKGKKVLKEISIKLKKTKKMLMNENNI
jgi:hypothetical protein